MKRFSSITSIHESESPLTQLNISNGVTNHYTPVQNILTNIKNIYCVHLGIVASLGEDNLSVKLTSSRFTSKEDCYKVLNEPIYKNLSLYQYIVSQGLQGVKYIDLGQFFVVYFYPTDVASPVGTRECKEMLTYNVEEAELDTFHIYEDSDEEITDEISSEKILEVIKMKDKVKAAKLLGALINEKLELPTEYYFAGVKSKEGAESIALRWKYIKRAPFDKSTECVKSIINIFDTDENNVWVGDRDPDGYFKLPTETSILVDSILKLLGAVETDDPCIYTIGDMNKKASELKTKKNDEGDDASKDDEGEKDDASKDEEPSSDSDDKSKDDDDDNLFK